MFAEDLVKAKIEQSVRSLGMGLVKGTKLVGVVSALEVVSASVGV